MIVRPWRLAALLLLGFVACSALVMVPPVWAQDEGTPAAEPAPTAPSTPTGQEPPSSLPAPPAASASQEGLPVGLRIDPETLDTQQQALESLRVYLVNTKPAGGIFARASRWVSRLFSGGPNYRSVTLAGLAANPNQVTNQDVAIEGLFRVKEDGTEVLVEGEQEVELERLPHTQVLGFEADPPDDMPARVEGNANQKAQGLVVTAHQITPAPVLTLVRLARCHELRATKLDYEQAVQLYGEAGKDATVTPWSGFAMAHGGILAAEVLRNEKRAADLYNKAWELEGRLKRVTPNDPPVTWVQTQSGAWEAQQLRKMVGKRLDAINARGFWYRFVDFFVTVSGGNAGVGLVLMAIVTRLLLYPLTRKQVQASRAMQQLQPQIKALQEKHGSDKKKFQEEFWRLCRSNSVNPFGGCWPLLVQMPLLLMVYRGIRAYIVQLESHGFLWIGSLADPDMPLLILYTISMIVFQKLTMKTQPMADPQQQQQQSMMVWMMPIMFFMFFQGLPSGFILYWLGTNLIYLPQQYFGTRVKREEADETKEKAITLEARSSANPGPGSGNGNEQPVPGLLGRLRELMGGRQQEDGGDGPQSLEQKQREEKQRKKRRPTRRRKRRP